jgi:FMN phosphatase YigB (HAD superfamily)
MTTAVIFDVGGVLLDWNPRYLYRSLFDGDTAAMERFLTDVCGPPWIMQQDAGRPFAEGVAELTARFPDQAERIAAFDAGWEAMVRGLFDDVVAIVERLAARRTPLYALTNFSMEKWPLVRPRYPVFERFDGIVVSGAEGLVKPDRRIYERLLARYGLCADACVFIDDSPINVAGAALLGIDAIRFTSAAALYAALERRGLL